MMETQGLEELRRQLAQSQADIAIGEKIADAFNEIRDAFKKCSRQLGKMAASAILTRTNEYMAILTDYHDNHYTRKMLWAKYPWMSKRQIRKVVRGR